MNFGELLLSNSISNVEDTFGPDDPIAKEMRILYKRNLRYDNKSAKDIVKNVALRTGVNPNTLFSSAFQEGMNKAIAKPDEVSEAYVTAKVPSDYPVDGFYNYGLDTFGDRVKDFQAKGYIPADFDYKPFVATNEKGENINTAAFRTNEDALLAKSAFLRSEEDTVKNYAKEKGIELDDDSLNYFTLASYNAGFGNAKKMIDKYQTTEDKKAFIDKGDPNWQKIHKNIKPRLENISVAKSLLEEQ